MAIKQFDIKLYHNTRLVAWPFFVGDTNYTAQLTVQPNIFVNGGKLVESAAQLQIVSNQTTITEFLFLGGVATLRPTFTLDCPYPTEVRIDFSKLSLPFAQGASYSFAVEAGFSEDISGNGNGFVSPAQIISSIRTAKKAVAALSMTSTITLITGAIEQFTSTPASVFASLIAPIYTASGESQLSVSSNLFSIVGAVELANATIASSFSIDATIGAIEQFDAQLDMVASMAVEGVVVTLNDPIIITAVASIDVDNTLARIFEADIVAEFNTVTIGDKNKGPGDTTLAAVTTLVADINPANLVLLFDTAKSFETYNNYGTSVSLHGPIDVIIDWGDGTSETVTSLGNPVNNIFNVFKDYGSPGLFEVTISGPVLYGFGVDNGSAGLSDPLWLVEVKSFLNNSGMESLSGAFTGASNLTALPRKMPTTITDLSYAFSDNVAVNTAYDNISNWDTTNVTTMTRAFNNCGNVSQNLSTWNTTNVNDMSFMFDGATVFTGIVNTWDVSNVTTFENMFAGATLFNRPLNSWVTTSVTNMSNMFNGASSFTQPVGVWDTSNVTTMQAMFRATPFNSDLNDWNVTSVEDMRFMFADNASYDQPLSLWAFKTSFPVNMQGMFRNATAFNQSLNDWDVIAIRNISNMFFGAVLFNQPLDAWNTQSVTTTEGTFRGATAFNRDISGWNVSNVQTMRFMFIDAINFNQPLNTWITTDNRDTSLMFDGATDFNQPIDNWDMNGVLSTQGMFRDAIAFDRPLDTWDMSTVTNAGEMFRGATVFNQPLNSWDVSLVEEFGGMFQDAIAFNQPIDNWVVDNGGGFVNMTDMFNGATVFNQNLNIWCVTFNTVEPVRFAINSALTEPNKPVWGTCPVRVTLFDIAMSVVSTLATVTTVIEGNPQRPPATITARGDAQLDTQYQQFGTASALFDGVDDVWSCATGDLLFDTQGSDYTIECWTRFKSAGGGIAPAEFIFAPAFNTGGPQVYATDNGTINAVDGLTGAAPVLTSAAGVVGTNTWQHIALVREGTTTSLYVDGISVASTTAAFSGEIVGPVGVGGYPDRPIGDPTDTVRGNIDEFRISDVARYTGASFTVPTAQFVDDLSTFLLLHFNGLDAVTTTEDDVTAA
jgi:surface protein